MVFFELLSSPLLWIIPWALQAIAYYFVLKKMGLDRRTCVIPFLAERQFSKVLFRRLRSFYRPFVLAVIFSVAGLYLGPEEGMGWTFMNIVFLIYGWFLIRLYWRMRKAFGRGIFFFIGMLILPPLFILILGLGKSEYTPLKLKPLPNHSKPVRILLKLLVALISAVEVLAIVAVVGFITVQTLPPGILVHSIHSDFAKNTKDIAADKYEVITREDMLGENAEQTIAALTPSREHYITDYSQAKDVVVYAYVIGSNLENQVGFSSVNIKQMIDATAKGPNLSFVLEAGGSKRWFTSGIAKESYGRYLIKDGKLTKIEDLPDDTCMSKPKVLKDFLAWAGKEYPADRAMLVFWDHGGGLAFGYGSDDLNPRDTENGTLTTEEVISAIADSGVHYDMIGFDACLMQDIEIAAELEPYTDYYIGSEEVEGGYGWYYTDAFGKLAEDPTISTEDFGKALISCYDQVNTIVKDQDGEPDSASTLSIVDTALAKPAYQELGTFFRGMRNKIRKDNTAYTDVAVAAANTYAFTDKFQIDVIDFLELLDTIDNDDTVVKKEEVTELTDALKASIIARNKDSAEGINGLAFAFPYQQIAAYEDTHKQLKKLSLNAERSAFNDIFSIMAVQLKNADDQPNLPVHGEVTITDSDLYQYISGEDPYDYTKEEWYVKGFENYAASTNIVDVPLTETPDGYSIGLPEDLWDTIVDCTTLAYQVMEDGNMRYLGIDHIGTDDAEGHPLIAMDDSWITVDGVQVCYETQKVRETKKGYIFTGRIPARLNDEYDITLNVEWEVTKDDQQAPQRGYITGYHITDKEKPLLTILVGKGTQTLEAGDTLEFLFDVYDAEGKFVKTEKSDQIVRVTKQNRLKVEDTKLPTCDIRYCGLLTDIYQRYITTEEVEAHID